MAIRILKNELYNSDGSYFEFDTEADILGEGGMGRVYLGKRVDKNGGITRVAIKAMFEGLPEQVIERARREASIQIYNDSLVRMYGFIETKDKDEFGTDVSHYHVISEYLDGISLEDLVVGNLSGRDGEINPVIAKFYKEYIADRPSKATEIIKSVLSGVMALHDSGYIHRDIDPSNIMVTTDGKVKLIDFGVAKQMVKLSTADKGLTSSGQFLGKAGYASPELVLGDVRHQNFSTDVYAIGVLYFYLLTGHLPFGGNSYDMMDAQLHKKLPLKEIKSKQICNVIKKATEKKQSDRYTTSSQMRAAIDAFKFPEAWYHNKAILGGIAASFAAAIVICSIIFSPTPEEPLTQDQIYAQALSQMGNSNPDSTMEGLETMTSLAEAGYAPAMYQVALTYAWAPSDETSAKRKEVLSLATDSLGLLVDNRKNEEAVEWFRKYMKNTDTPDNNALYLLGCYYLNGKVVSRDIATAKELFEKGKQNAIVTNDSIYLAKFNEVLDYINSLK